MEDRLASFLSSLTDPRYSSPDHDPGQTIILTGVLDGVETPFFASPTDILSYGRELHRRAASGELGEIGDYVEPPPVEFPPAPTRKGK